MYNLQKAKDEIDAVAKHATDVTEYVITLGEMLHGFESSFESKLDAFKTELLSAIDAKLAEVKRTILGSEGETVATSFVDDLGSKVSLLKRRGTTAAPEDAPSATDTHPHQAEPQHSEHAEVHHE